MLVILGLLALSPALGAQFVLVDDHEILRLSSPTAGPPMAILVSIVTSSDPQAGRFRPVYWAARLSEIAVFQDRPYAWHTFLLITALGSAVLLYATWRSLTVAEAPAALLGFWLLVAPGASSIWVRLGANESIATPLLLLAMFAAVRAAGGAGRWWDVLFVTSAIGTFLAKESFALAAPALAGFRVIAVLIRRKIRTWRVPSGWVVLTAGLAIALIDFAIAERAGLNSYAGEFLSSPDIRTYAFDFAHNLIIIAFAASVWLVPVVLWSNPFRCAPPRVRTIGLWSVALVLLLALPQVLLYSREGVLEGKYELPAVIGVAGLIIGALIWRRSTGNKTIYKFGLIGWALACGAFAFSTWTYASYFTQDSLQLQKMVGYVAANTSAGRIVGIAGEPAADYEPMLSLIDQLAHAGRPDIQLKALQVAPETAYGPREAELARELLATPLGQPDPIRPPDCTKLAALIVLRDETAARGALPCLSGFRRLEFTDSVLLWGGDQVSLRPRLPGYGRPGYVLLVARDA